MHTGPVAISSGVIYVQYLFHQKYHVIVVMDIARCFFDVIKVTQEENCGEKVYFLGFKLTLNEI